MIQFEFNQYQIIALIVVALAALSALVIVYRQYIAARLSQDVKQVIVDAFITHGDQILDALFDALAERVAKTAGTADDIAVERLRVELQKRIDRIKTDQFTASGK